MAKKEENFDFDTEDKAKFKFDLSFVNNLTKQQRGIILIAAVAIVLVIAIVITCVVIGANGGVGENGGGSNGGSSASGSNGDNGSASAITLSSAPIKRTYFVGEFPDYKGLSINVNYNGGGVITVYYDETPDGFKFEGFDTSAPAKEQVVTVEYAGKTDTFTIEVKEIESDTPILVSIHFSKYPQQIFGVDDNFSYRDAVLTCTYSDGSTVDIPLKSSYMYGLSEIFDPSDEHVLLPGEHTIRIEYGENGVFVQTEYTITVN